MRWGRLAGDKGLPRFCCTAKSPSSQILHTPPILGRPLVLTSRSRERPFFEIGATFMKTVRFVLTLFALSFLVPIFLAPWHSAEAADVICYNCPPEWADWASMLKAVKADLNYDIPHDNKNSGQ